MPPNIRTLLLGLLLGAAIGFASSAPLHRLSVTPKTSTLLRDFSFPAFTANLTSTTWEILEDRTYQPFPASSRYPRTARRIVAHAELPKEDLAKFTAQFPSATTAALDKHGALNKAQFDLAKDSTQVINGSPTTSRIELPRRYYAIGDIQGVADIGYIMESTRVTVIISFIEGL